MLIIEVTVLTHSVIKQLTFQLHVWDKYVEATLNGTTATDRRSPSVRQPMKMLLEISNMRYLCMYKTKMVPPLVVNTRNLSRRSHIVNIRRIVSGLPQVPYCSHCVRFPEMFMMKLLTVLWAEELLRSLAYTYIMINTVNCN